jgi:hypothetical protein
VSIVFCDKELQEQELNENLHTHVRHVTARGKRNSDPGHALLRPLSYPPLGNCGQPSPALVHAVFVVGVEPQFLSIQRLQEGCHAQ